MFLKFKSTDSISVATAFFHAMHDFDKIHSSQSDNDHGFIHSPSEEVSMPNSSQEINDNEEENNGSSPKTPTLLTANNESTLTNKN
jgi:hypothetical protein